MATGLGEASAVISLIQAATSITGWVQDVKMSQEERQRLLREMGRLTLILGSIHDRLKDYKTKAKSADIWYANLLDLAEGCGTIQRDGSIKPWSSLAGKPEGALARMQVVIGQLLVELEPAHGTKRVVQTLKYTWDKKKFDSMLSEIMRLTAEIGVLLDADQFKLLISLKDDEKVIHEQLRNIQDRVNIDASHIQKLLAGSEASTKLSEDTNVRVSDIADGQKASADLEQKLFAVSQLTKTDVEEMKDKVIDMRDHMKASEAVGQVNFAIASGIWQQGTSTNQELHLIKDNLKPIGAMGLKNFHLQMAVQSHMLDTSERVRMIEDRQRQEQEERDREREERKRKGLEEEKEEIQEWLSPRKDLARQYEISGQCYPLGQWLLDSVAYKQWIQGRHWYLLLYGEAGSGKTVLSSIVARHLQKHFSNPKMPVICLFLDQKDSKNQTVEYLFGSLLKQLLQLQEPQSVGVPQDLRTLHQRARAINAKPHLKDVCDLLQAHFTTYDRVYIIVDALDECPLQVRPALQRQLRHFGTERVSLMFTSRVAENNRDNKLCCNRCGKDPIVEPIYYQCKLCLEDGYAYDVCQDCRDNGLFCKDQSHLLTEPYGSVEIEITTPDEEIERYVRWEIGQELEVDQSATHDEWIYRGSPGETRLQRHFRTSPKLQKDLTPTVVALAEHRFLFAKLYMDILKSQTSVMATREALKTLPKGLDSIYDDAMRRIDAQDRTDRDLALDILSILVCAHRNLRVGELKHVLAVRQKPEQFGSDGWDDSDGCVGVTTILECTLGLISISDIEDDLGAVRMHYTLQEYLSDCHRRARYFPEAEKGMATACLTYLKLDVFSHPSRDKVDFDTRKKRYPFISYASQYWGDHVREAGPDEKLRADSFVLVCDRTRVAAFVETAWMTGEGGREGWDVHKGLDGFHVCAWYGLSGALSRFGSTSIIVDITEPTFLQTPLMYACRKGHVEVVRQLLDLGASVRITSARGRTPWFEAVEGGHYKVVDLLLGRSELEIDINSIQLVDFNRTALMQAANLNYESIISKLLKHPDIKVNLQDALGYTALSLATVKGFHSVVELLLMHPDIKLDIKEYKNERSALVLAAERDDKETVRTLLQSGADWQMKDRQGGTAVLRAVDYGCVLALDVLKSNNASLHCVDEDGRTLLHGASRGGYSEIVSLLVKEGLDKDQEDNIGLTPLHEASRQGNPEVIKVLLDLGADSTLKDKFGRTPFTIAWQYGQKDVMDMLPHEEQIPNDEALPIWALARRGLKSLFTKALEARKDDALEREPCIENSPLHCAVFAKDPEILRILLEDTEIPLDSTNHVGRSALHVAAFSGNLQAAKDLINHGAKLDQHDQWGDSPLALSRRNHYYSLMIALIEAGAALDLRKIQEMLFRSAEIGSVKAVKRLLESGANANDKDVDGRTALDIVKGADNGELLQVLQSTQTFSQRDNVATTEQAQIGKVARSDIPSLPSFQPLKLPFRSPQLDQTNSSLFDLPSGPEKLVQPVLELA